MEVENHNCLIHLPISFKYPRDKMDKESLVMGTNNLCSVFQLPFLLKTMRSAIG